MPLAQPRIDLQQLVLPGEFVALEVEIGHAAIADAGQHLGGEHLQLGQAQVLAVGAAADMRRIVAQLAPAAAGAHRTVRADVDIDGEMLAVAARHIVLRDDVEAMRRQHPRDLAQPLRRLDHHRLGACHRRLHARVLPGHRLRRLDDHREGDLAGDDVLDLRHALDPQGARHRQILLPGQLVEARLVHQLRHQVGRGQRRPDALAQTGQNLQQRLQIRIRGREDHWRRAVLGFDLAQRTRQALRMAGEVRHMPEARAVARMA